MKILFWMDGSFDRRTPSEHLLIAMIEALYRKGHTVHVLQKDTDGPLPKLPSQLEALGVTTVAIPAAVPKKRNFIARYLADLKHVAASKKHIHKKDGYGAILVQSTNVAGFAIPMLKRRAPGARIVFNIQDIFPYNAASSGTLSQSGIIFKTLAALQRHGYKKADHIITISEDMKILLIEDGVPEEKIDFIYNWSYQDTPFREEDLNRATLREIFPEDRFNVVYAGNIGVMQNVDLLIDTAILMKNEKEIHFHIVGDGAYKDKLIQKAEDAGIDNVSFHRMLSSDLAPSLYATADVNVIPLVKNVYKTALPSKTATCFACGTPVILCIGTASKFAQSAQEATNCQSVESDDAEGLRNAILAVRKEPDAVGYDTFFTATFSRTKNSDRYAKIITGEASVNP